MAEQDWVDVDNEWEDVADQSPRSVSQIFKRVMSGYKSPQDIVSGIAPFKAGQEISSSIKEFATPNIQKIPIIKDIPFAAGILSDPMTYVGYGRPSFLREATRTAIPRSVKNVLRPVPFAERMRGEFYKVKQSAVDKFGKDLDSLASANPSKSVSLRDIVDNLKSSFEELSPEVRSVIRKIPQLNKMLDDPQLANNVSLSDTQNIINYINTKVPKNIKFKHLDILDLVNDVRASQLDAFPAMEGIRESYAKVIEPFNKVKNQFRFNRLLNAIQTNFGGHEGMKAVRDVLPKSVLNEMGGYKNALKILKTLGVSSIAGGGVYGLSSLAGKVFRDATGGLGITK